MNKQDVINKVHTRTYYIAESKKREMPDLAIMQTSSDNSDILSDYIDAAVEELMAYMQKRLLEVEWDGESLKVTSSRDKAELMLIQLDKAIADYLVEELCYRWVSDTFPKLTNESLREKKLDYVKDIVCSLAPRIRRRATTMGV